MRYWLLQNDEPVGPFTADDLDQSPGFSRASLVYPEKRLDPSDERWLRAGDVPQLAVALAEIERRAFAGRYIVPEPTVRDLPVLGSIMKQLERFEEELVGFRGSLLARHQELVELREDSDTGAHRQQVSNEEIQELEKRLEKIEPLEADILRLREAGLEAAQSARGVEERMAREIAEMNKRLISIEGDMDAEAQQDMLRMYTASLQERIEELGTGLKRESDAGSLVRKELSGFRSSHTKERSERGFLAGGKQFGKPEALVFFLIAALAGAIGYLFYIGRKPVPPPVPVVVVEPPPPPPKPVVLKPKPKVKPRVRRKRLSSNQRAAQKAREKKVRDTILFRVTGGVPSSKRSAIAERKPKPRTAPEPPKN